MFNSLLINRLMSQESTSERKFCSFLLFVLHWLYSSRMWGWDRLLFSTMKLVLSYNHNALPSRRSLSKSTVYTPHSSKITPETYWQCGYPHITDCKYICCEPWKWLLSLEISSFNPYLYTNISQNFLDTMKDGLI